MEEAEKTKGFVVQWRSCCTRGSNDVREINALYRTLQAYLLYNEFIDFDGPMHFTQRLLNDVETCMVATQV